MKPKELVRHELIGLRVKVHDAENKALIGISGMVVDETKNMLELETTQGKKKIIKDQAVFDFEVEGKTVRVKGSFLSKRPEERTKKV